MTPGGIDSARTNQAASDPTPERLIAAEASLPSDPQQARTLAREVLGRPEEPRAAARALLVIGTAEYRLGQAQEAVPSLLEAEHHFSALNDRAGVLEALLALVRAERDLGRFEIAAKRCDEALALSRSLHDLGAEADSLNLHASVCSALGEYPQALEYLVAALAIARECGLREREGNILSNIGTLHTLLGDHVRALESLTAAHEVVRETAPGTRTEGTNLISLGRLYGEMGDTAGANTFFTQARNVARQAGDRMVEAAAANNLAIVRSTSGDWTAAGELFREALGIARELGMRQYEIDNLDGLGQVYVALEEHARALDTHLEALEVAREIGDREGQIDALLNLGRDHLAMARPTEAIGPLREGLNLAKRIERKGSIYQAHERLAEAYEAAGDAVRALRHYREFHRVEKAVFNEESGQKTRRLAVQFDLERARHEAEQYRLRTEISQQARSKAEAEVRERTRELQEAQLEIITRLAVAAEHRDDETGEHTWRVGRNAAAIARALAWPEDDVDLILSAAPLHDVGKIGIRDAILLKPGKLTADEFELMQSHTTIGARILSGGRSRLLRLAEEIALGHHERWDGKGYPRGLAGDAIPLAARIVSVADVLDALTHARPYKQAWPVADALAEIQRQSGQQFDPRVVGACMHVFATEESPSPLDDVDRSPDKDRLQPDVPYASGV